MSINDNFLKIEKKFAWSFFGFLLAIIFGGFSIYTVYFKDTNPRLDFIIETNTKVLDVRENVRKLDILYQGENIKQSGKNLSILKIKIQNSSDVNILNTFYDYKDPLGFKLEKAEIVERPEIIESSNDYLKHNLTFSIDSFGNIKFNPVIIDANEYFIIKILALHKQRETPILKPFGKIAGIKVFKVIESYKLAESKTFWDELLQGGFWIHVVRFLGYLLIVGIVVITIAIPSSLISDGLTTRKRKRNVKRYKSKKNLSDSPERTLIYDSYLEHGLYYLTSMQKLLFDERMLKIRLRNYLRRKDKSPNAIREERLDELRAITAGRIEYVSDSREGIIFHDRFTIVRKLYDAQIIKLENNELVVSKIFINDLNEFISYLKLV